MPSIGQDVTSFDLICLSHLRWDFVYQRPQHLMTRAAHDHRVYFVEEPVLDDGMAHLDVSGRDGGVTVVVPHLPHGLSDTENEAEQAHLLAAFMAAQNITTYVLWYYTPMALGFTADLTPVCTIYDCMDELANFWNPPPMLRPREADLFRRADLVFTGGQSLYEAKQTQHPHVYAFPSSVDVPHFAQARNPQPDPPDQAAIPRPRIGFYGVIDERMDVELLHGIAEARPDYQWVIIGPTVKIDPTTLPHTANVHYLGGKNYKELPAYLAGWDVAMLPFARNESTRFISPTKTPEYLAAGVPVVSTSIRDVVRPYGDLNLVRIADTPDDFVAAVAAALTEDAGARQRRVDSFLQRMSWDRTWAQMLALIDAVIATVQSSGVAPVA